tara:strand:- start:102 stop:560 length:459 start_codon:yes stop_codon:yes gene_type:complete
MSFKFISLVFLTFFFLNFNYSFAGEPLALPVVEGSHSVGNDLNELGIRAYKKRNYEKALNHFQMASIVDWKKAEIFFNLGLTLHHLDQHVESARHFQRAIKLAPENRLISESKVLEKYDCKNNPEIFCNLPPLQKKKLEGSRNNLPRRYLTY